MTANTDDLPEGFIESEEQFALTPDLIAKLRETASSRTRPKTNFGRCFDVEAAQKCQDLWWRDLLRLWRPAGVPSGDLGLRLAVRDGYLNFYRKGQSVARVEVKRGHLVGYVHAKYVQPHREAELAQQYVEVRGDGLTLRGESLGSYGGVASVAAWTKTTAKWSGPEKRQIDEVLDCTDNIIDLEMGQPGTGLRMDIVSVERDNADLWVAFWEAKLAGDPRVRCRDESIVPRTLPKVLRQLGDYEDFIAADGNRALVADAYRATASILIALRDLADSVGPAYPIGAEIREAATVSPLLVRQNARLLIFEPDDRAWPTHEKKLRDAGVEMLVAAAGKKLAWGDCA